VPDLPNDVLSTIDSLLGASRASRYQDPLRMIYLAELAQAAANRLDPLQVRPDVIADTHARVWAELGNAYRLADLLDRAEVAFKSAVDELERGSGDPLLAAQVADRFASLLFHRRRFPGAFALLDRLAAFYAARGESHLAGRALITRGAFAENAGDPETAIRYTVGGLERIEPERDATLLLTAVHNLVSAATDLGLDAVVAEFLPRIRPLYGSDRLNVLRLRWLEGRLAAATGQADAAEAAFGDARAGFAESRLIFPASLVTIDLALLFAQGGRRAEIIPLAEEVMASFRALRVGREAILALLLLRRACEDDGQALARVAERLLEIRHLLADLERRSN
jgi:tetratricopeptide (TPR) repeat protein